MRKLKHAPAKKQVCPPENWTADDKCKQLLIERSQLEQALLSTAVRQLKPGPILRQAEQYWFSLDDLLLFPLAFQNDQKASRKHYRIAARINLAIEELEAQNSPSPNVA